ncbi:MAG: SH3 domain-containing protein [Anaerolineae bacterium]|nr:SH3 domain-containing protein [Chloroflexota bacterium]MBP6297799.1 SH3 domain-containing protein [Anaerolineae bacterium]
MKRTTLGIFFVVLTVAVLGSLLTISVSAQTTGTNWTGTFYNNTDLSGSPAASNEPYPSGVFANWGSGSPLRADNSTPVPGVNPDNFSARFTSSQVFSTAGTYTFTVYVDDGVRVFVNSAIVLDQFNQNTTGNYRTFTFQQTVSAGQTLSITLEFVEFTGNAVMSFQWGLSTGGTPTGPTATAVPPALGNVFTVRGLALRTGPYLGASMIGVVRPDFNFPILEKNFDEGLFPWYKIQDNNQRIGWVSGRYLNVTGNIDLVPERSTHFDQIDNPSDLPVLLDVVGYTRSVMNFRRRPSQRTTLLGQIPWGDPVEVIGRTVQGGQNFWLQVRYKGVVGWIYAPFVKLEGVVDAVPIR